MRACPQALQALTDMSRARPAHPSQDSVVHAAPGSGSGNWTFAKMDHRVSSETPATRTSSNVPRGALHFHRRLLDEAGGRALVALQRRLPREQVPDHGALCLQVANLSLRRPGHPLHVQDNSVRGLVLEHASHQKAR